jgi:TonB family protein
MKNRRLYGYLILFTLSFSCVNFQHGAKGRIYMRDEVDTKPAYPGGPGAMKAFVQKKLKWPKEYGYNGYVIVSAVITRNGNIVNSKIRRSLCVFCDTAALSVLKKMPRWSPGLVRGKPVNTEVEIPIRFELSK